MIEEQDSICWKIIKQLKEIPVWRIFSDDHLNEIPKSISKPITFELIESRLQHHLYKSSDAWVAEMRRFFMNEIENSTQNKLRKSAATLLSQRFEEIMQTIAPGLSPHILSVQVKEQELQELLDQMASEIPLSQPKIGQPNATIFNNLNDNEEVTPERIIYKTQLLKFPELVLKVIAYVYKLQPECIAYGQTLAINFSLFKEENLQLINKYINKLLQDAASGKINPMRRVSMTSIIPTEIRSV